jgi:hypothetical protein
MSWKCCSVKFLKSANSLWPITWPVKARLDSVSLNWSTSNHFSKYRILDWQAMRGVSRDAELPFPASYPVAYLIYSILRNLQLISHKLGTTSPPSKIKSYPLITQGTTKHLFHYCVFSRRRKNSLSTELFPNNGCCTVACLHSCYLTMGLHDTILFFCCDCIVAWRAASDYVKTPYCPIHTTLLHRAEEFLLRAVYGLATFLASSTLLLRRHVRGALKNSFAWLMLLNYRKCFLGFIRIFCRRRIEVGLLFRTLLQ